MNILISTCGRDSQKIYFFKEALGDKGKVFASNSKMTSTLLKADGYVLTPLIHDNSYIDFLITYCQKNNIEAVFSFYEMDMIVLAKNKERFQKHGIAVVVSDESKIQLCHDKWKCYQFLSSIGLKQPKTYIDVNLLKQDTQSGLISFPLIFKPRWGSASFGLYQVDSFDEIDIIRQYIIHKILNSNFKHESEQDKDFCVLMQEKLYGQEYGLDVFNDLQGNYITTIPKTKTEMRRGITIFSYVHSNKPFEHTGKTISQNLKHVGNIGVDCFLTESDDVIVIEINPHFVTHYSFSHLAGAKFHKQIIEWLSGNPTSEKYTSYETDVAGYNDDPQVVRF